MLGGKDQLAPFETLRVLVSVGAVLTAPIYEWAQEAFGEDVHVFSGMGATDTCSTRMSRITYQSTRLGSLDVKLFLARRLYPSTLGVGIGVFTIRSRCMLTYLQ